MNTLQIEHLRINKRGNVRWREDHNGCWIWQLKVQVNRDGSMYGRIWFGSGGSKSQMAHRWVYEQLKCSIPEKVQLHHDCENTLCVNPDHLVQKTAIQHVHEHHLGRRSTHCRRGHIRSDDNLYVSPQGERRCRLCDREAYLRRTEERDHAAR